MFIYVTVLSVNRKKIDMDSARSAYSVDTPVLYLPKVLYFSIKLLPPNHDICSLDWLATGKIRKHLGLYYTGPLCAARVNFLHQLQGHPCCSHECAALSWESPEPLELEQSPLLAKEESSGEKWPTEFCLPIRLTRNRKGSLTCRKSATRDPRLYFPSEGRHA
jgi:hypothetical protein